MKKEIVYWVMKDGVSISVDDMDINHLRNTLKMIIKARRPKPKPKSNFRVNGEIASEFADMARLHAINPEITCECDEEFNIVCQQCK